MYKQVKNIQQTPDVHTGSGVTKCYFHQEVLQFLVKILY